MLYRNKETGVEIEVNSVISGGGWEPVSGDNAGSEKKASEEKPKKPAKKGKK